MNWKMLMEGNIFELKQIRFYFYCVYIRHYLIYFDYNNILYYYLYYILNIYIVSKNRNYYLP